MSNQPKTKSRNSVADQIRVLMEQSPQSLDNIQYGEIVIKVRAGRCVHMNVNHAFKLEDTGDTNGDDKT